MFSSDKHAKVSMAGHNFILTDLWGLRLPMQYKSKWRQACDDEFSKAAFFSVQHIGWDGQLSCCPPYTDEIFFLSATLLRVPASLVGLGFNSILWRLNLSPFAVLVLQSKPQRYQDRYPKRPDTTSYRLTAQSVFFSASRDSLNSWKFSVFQRMLFFCSELRILRLLSSNYCWEKKKIVLFFLSFRQEIQKHTSIQQMFTGHLLWWLNFMCKLG